MQGWLTNSPTVAAALNKADAEFDAARAAARPLPLSEKIIALREAKSARQFAYNAAMKAA